MKYLKLFIALAAMLSACSTAAVSDPSAVKYIAVYGDIWDGQKDITVYGYDDEQDKCFRNTYNITTPYHMTESDGSLYLLGGTELYRMDTETLEITSNNTQSGPAEEIVSGNSGVLYLNYGIMNAENKFISSVRTAEGKQLYSFEGTAPHIAFFEDRIILSDTDLETSSVLLEMEPDGTVTEQFEFPFVILGMYILQDRLIAYTPEGYMDIFAEETISPSFEENAAIEKLSDTVLIRKTFYNRLFADIYQNGKITFREIELPASVQKPLAVCTANDVILFSAKTDNGLKFFEINPDTMETSEMKIPCLAKSGQELIGIWKKP